MLLVAWGRAGIAKRMEGSREWGSRPFFPPMSSIAALFGASKF